MVHLTSLYKYPLRTLLYACDYFFTFSNSNGLQRHLNQDCVQDLIKILHYIYLFIAHSRLRTVYVVYLPASVQRISLNLLQSIKY